MLILGALAFGIGVFFAIGLMTNKAPQVRFGNSSPKPEQNKRQIWLTQAGVELSPLQFYAGLTFVGLVVFGLVSAMTGAPAVAIAPALGAAALPYAFFAKKRQNRLSATTRAWPDAILELTSSIESNASLHGALVTLSHRGPDALRPAFERFDQLSTTIGVVAALEVVRERLADPTSDRVIEVLILAHERGGGIVTDILRDLAHATTEDLQLSEEIESSQLEQKINARAVFVIPWGILILLVAFNAQYREFYQSALGYVVILVGGAGSALGMFVVARLARPILETRVFGGSAVSKKRHSPLSSSNDDNHDDNRKHIHGREEVA